MALPQTPRSPLIVQPQTPVGLARHQIGIFPAYISDRTETFIVKEKGLSITGDDFEVCHVDGFPILKVKGAVMTMSRRKRATISFPSSRSISISILRLLWKTLKER
ncbi:hypothetical protein LB505_002463 [Fusarium chuoi]|nr:hypothetical protein LB505_002463 [Fusarium chuoi]